MVEVSNRSNSPKGQKLYFFGTCLIDVMTPEAGLAAVRLLEREGYEVLFPQNQTCCGQPAYTAGFQKEAWAVAEKQLALFPEPWPIVVPSGSCAGMMKFHWTSLMPLKHKFRSELKGVTDRIVEFAAFYNQVLSKPLIDRGPKIKVALHTSCTARRELNTHEPTRALVQQLANVEIVHQMHEVECCGFGGTFTLRHPDVSAAMAHDKAQAIIDSGVELILSADCGCLANINGTLAKMQAKTPSDKPLVGEHLSVFIAQRIGLDINSSLFL